MLLMRPPLVRDRRSASWVCQGGPVRLRPVDARRRRPALVTAQNPEGTACGGATEPAGDDPLCRAPRRRPRPCCFLAACRMGLEAHRLEAGREPLQVRSLRVVAKGQKPRIRAELRRLMDKERIRPASQSAAAASFGTTTMAQKTASPAFTVLTSHVVRPMSLKNTSKQRSYRRSLQR